MSNNQFNLTFETELNEGIRVTTLSPVFCSGDNEAHSFIVKAMRNGKPVSLSGATVRGFFIRPDNVTITLEGNVNASGEAVVTLTDSCYYKQGRIQLVIRATINGVASTLFCGIGGMLLASTDSFIDEGNIVPSLDDLLAQIDAMKEATAAALEAAARANEAAENAGSGGSYPVVGYVDADNNIILTSDDLAAGTYTFKYENANGTQSEIGTVEVGSGDDTGTEETTFDVPISWILGTKLSKTDGSVEDTASTTYNASDFITLVDSASYVVATTNDCFNSMNVVYYDANNAFVGYQADLWTSNQVEQDQGQSQSAALVIPDGATKIRLRQYEAANVQGWSTGFVTLTGTKA